MQKIIPGLLDNTLELFNEDEKKKEIAKLEIELETLQLDLAKEIEVNY